MQTWWHQMATERQQCSNSTKGNCDGGKDLCHPLNVIIKYVATIFAYLLQICHLTMLTGTGGWTLFSFCINVLKILDCLTCLHRTTFL